MDHYNTLAEFKRIIVANYEHEMPEMTLAISRAFENGKTFPRSHTSSTVREIVSFFEREKVPVWDSFYIDAKDEVEDLKFEDLRSYCLEQGRNFLEKSNGLFMFCQDTEDYTTDQLAGMLAAIEYERIPPEVIDEEAIFRYNEQFIRPALEKFKKEKYDPYQLNVWNYEDELTEELNIHTGRDLEDYVEGDYDLLTEIYFDEIPDIKYDGTFNELSDKAKIYIRLV